MSDKIQPALTPEEWREWINDPEGTGYFPYFDVKVTDEDGGAGCHRAAARCLYGMPFGFTWADVEAVRACADAVEREVLGRANVYPAALDPVIRMRDLADRIESLLPPEPPA